MVTGLNDPDAAPDDGPPCSRANGCFHLRIVRFGALRRFRPNATIGERAGLWITAVDSGRDDVSRPVSRVLSAAQSAAGRPFLWDGSCETPRATNPDDWPGDRLTAPAHACGAIASSLFGFAPGGVCPAVAVTGDAVGSYPTVSPLPLGGSGKPDQGAVSFLWRFPSGCPARALPGTVPSWSPDFPLRRLCPAKATPRMSHMRVTGVVVGHATRVDAAAIQPSAHPRPRRRRVARQWGRAGRQGLRG